MKNYGKRSHLPKKNWDLNPGLPGFRDICFLQLCSVLPRELLFLPSRLGPVPKVAGPPTAPSLSLGLRPRGNLVAIGSEPVLSGGISGTSSCFRQDSIPFPGCQGPNRMVNMPGGEGQDSKDQTGPLLTVLFRGFALPTCAKH